MPNIWNIIESEYVWWLRKQKFPLSMQGYIKITRRKLSTLVSLPEHDKIEKVFPWHCHQVPVKDNEKLQSKYGTNMKTRLKSNRQTFELRQARRFGVNPNPLSWRTLCWVGFVFCNTFPIYLLTVQNRSKIQSKYIFSCLFLRRMNKNSSLIANSLQYLFTNNIENRHQADMN